jgi:hypothetical protein
MVADTFIPKVWKNEIIRTFTIPRCTNFTVSQAFASCEITFLGQVVKGMSQLVCEDFLIRFLRGFDSIDTESDLERIYF